MNRDELITKLYNSSIRVAISEKYRECGKEETILVRRTEELHNFLESEEGRSLPWREHADLESELSNCARKLDVIRIRRETWEQARELCLDIADEVLVLKEDETNG